MHSHLLIHSFYTQSSHKPFSNARILFLIFEFDVYCVTKYWGTFFVVVLFKDLRKSAIHLIPGRSNWKEILFLCFWFIPPLCFSSPWASENLQKSTHFERRSSRYSSGRPVSYAWIVHSRLLNSKLQGTCSRKTDGIISCREKRWT